LLRDRIGLELTYFDKTSKDLLLTQPLAPSSGSRPARWSTLAPSRTRCRDHAPRHGSRSQERDARRVAQANTLANAITSMGTITPFVSSNNQCFKPGVEIAAWCVPRVLMSTL
jgi:hypothetical protein